MKSTFRSRFWKTGKWFLGFFLLLFAFRLTYGYLEPESRVSGDYSVDFFNSIDNLRKNYASEKEVTIMRRGDIQAASAIASSQKYEKTASIKTKTSEFEKHEKLLKSESKAFNAVIQYEQSLGQKGNRQLHLLIGVNPELFDSLYSVLSKIGSLRATEITKVDKTNEYRQLQAKKASIEKTLQSLNELKSKGGQIADFVALNDKILEIEEKAQELGVELGNFDAENEFCTIKLSMYEGATERNVTFLHRVKVALEWAIRYFTLSVAAMLILTLTIYVLLLIVDKLKIINAVSRRINE